MSWEKKVIVWDLKQQSLEIRKLKSFGKSPSLYKIITAGNNLFRHETDPTACMTCRLPSKSNSISIFLDSKTESKVSVGIGTVNNEARILIGCLNLGQLGMGERLSRRWGNYKQLYIVKNSSTEADPLEKVSDDQRRF